jgi:CVNH domain
MRYLTMFGMLTLAAALWVPATGAAQQVPGGSYRQTCRDIGARGSTLYATCQDAGGGWQSSELRDFQRCGSEIQNINGSLQCNTVGNRWYDDQNQGGDRGRDGDHGRDGDRGYNRGPRGSYAQSCQNISTNGSTLQASCQKRNGGWRQTSLRHYNQCNGDITNNNGRLQCAR